MNLYQINSGVHDKVLQSANHDIKLYTGFLSKAIELLEKETHSIKVKKHIEEIERLVDGIKRIEKETRYIPLPPTNKKEGNAIEILFNENTKVVFDQKKGFNKYINVDTRNEEENYIVLSTDIQGDMLYLRPETYQLNQQRKALDNLRNRPLAEHQPLLNLFGYPNSWVWGQNWRPTNFTWTILTDETKDGVIEQREFVAKAFQTKDFALLEGPPGSGKTTTIIELIMQFAAEGKRVLLCSATHAAIDNVIERIKGRYRAICDSEIIPVRISRDDYQIKESVRPYLLKNLIKTYKQDIEKHLRKNKLLESQKYLLENLHVKLGEGKDPIEKIILDSANLVAGTMIGILQHPDIKLNKLGASFDVLVVDEASKVTFSDFIVPALHAKKWILVGDVKQLSPYVEDDYVSENIASMLDESKQQEIVKQFELKAKLDDPNYDDCLKVYFTKNVQENGFIKNGLFVETITETWEPTVANLTRLNAADVVIAKDNRNICQLLGEHIQVKAIFINGETSTTNQAFRQQYFRKSSSKGQSYLLDSREERWADLVAGKLSQSFSFRNAGEGFSNIDKDLDHLVPEEIREEISRIKRLVFPSILELLQTGVGKSEGQRNDKVISDGFFEKFKESRFTSLSYQHRMHPDIAQTSKKHFYTNNLHPANTVTARNWGYAENDPAIKWIPNDDKTGNIRGTRIINPTEVRDIENELLKFLNWAKVNPLVVKNPITGTEENHPYEVAVLTFYLNQETELRKMIRSITNQRHHSKFNKHNTNIYLYTVDKFQGQEADLVLLGFTKFSQQAHYNSPNRLNVALTRARHKLLLFGNKAWFERKAKLEALKYLATHFESTIRY